MVKIRTEVSEPDFLSTMFMFDVRLFFVVADTPDLSCITYIHW